MRYVVFGAGAIGGAVGGRLHAAGRQVVLIARGRHLEAMRRHGLRLLSPDEELSLRVPVAADPAEAAVADGDVVILATKTQDTDGALRALAPVAPPGITVVCAQNGVENERLALRRFAHVLGMCVVLPGSHLAPGVVEVSCAPIAGVLDVGGYPVGAGSPSGEIAADLGGAGFHSRAVTDVMRWKYAKLLANLGNALEASLGRGAPDSGLLATAREEALACYRAAGVTAASEREQAARWGRLPALRPIAGADRGGGSSWQSLARAAGTVEVDYLNGEVVLLGRANGVATPVNAMLQRVLTRMARDRLPPGSLSVHDLYEELENARGVPARAI